MTSRNTYWKACLTLGILLAASLVGGSAPVPAGAGAFAAVAAASLPDGPLEAGPSSALPVVPTSLPLTYEVHGDDERHARIILDPALERRVDPRLLEVTRLESDGRFDAAGRVPVVVTAEPGLHPLLERLGLLTDVKVLSNLGLLVGDLRLDDLPVLLETPGVARIDLDGHAVLHLAESVPLIRADQVHARVDGDGTPVTGNGTIIAILDTGIDYTHAHLGGCFGSGCKVEAGYDHVDDDDDPMDDHGHGTHVAATAAGSEGVAPGATLWAHKVCDRNGTCPESALLAAMDGLVGSDADVISMSLGARSDCIACPLAAAAQALVDDGKVVVASAGNAGPEQRTISLPAIVRDVIAVGATDKNDRLADFSSRGPVYQDGEIYAIKPDLVAPGVDITAAVPTGVCILCSPLGERTISGTSMAAPHVSGAAALLLQEHPGWTAADVRGALLGGTAQVAGTPQEIGTGRLDALSATETEVVVASHNAYIGRIGSSVGHFNLSHAFTLRNIGPDPVSVDLAATAPLLHAGFDTTTVGLATGASATVTLTAGGHSDDLHGGLVGGTITATSGLKQTLARFSMLEEILAHIRPDGGRLLFSYDHDREAYTFSHPSGDFDLPVQAGNHSFAVHYPCLVVSDCTIAYVFRDNVTIDRDVWINTTRSDATHPFRMTAETAPGEWIEPSAAVECWDPPPCATEKFVSLVPPRTHFRPETDFIRKGSEIRVTNASEIWTLGLGIGMRIENDTWYWSNHTQGVTGPVDLARPLDARHSVEVVYNDPRGHPYLERWLRCNSNTAPGGSEERAVSDGEVEVLHLDLNWEVAEPFASWSQTRVALNPCAQLNNLLLGGTSQFATAPLAETPAIRAAGDHLTTFRTFGDGIRGEFVDTLYDGRIVLGDGAPGFGGHMEEDAGSLTASSGYFTRYDLWMSPGGGSDTRVSTFQAQRDGASVAWGSPYRDAILQPYWKFNNMIQVPLLDAVDAGIQVDNPDTTLLGVTCAARYSFDYARNATDGVFPHIAWARAQQDKGPTSRFSNGTNISLDIGLFGISPDENTSMEVALRKGQDLVHRVQGIHPASDSRVLLQLPELSVGAYRLQIDVDTSGGEHAMLRQDPAFIIGSGGCGFIPPVAYGAADTIDPDVGEGFELNATGSYDPHGQPLDLTWSGPGVDTSDAVVPLVLKNGGTRCYTLLVTDTEAGTDDDTVCIQAHGPIAVAQIDGPSRTNLSQNVRFDATATTHTDDEPLVLYQWRDEQGTELGNTTLHNETFETAGTHCRTLHVTDAAGRTSVDGPVCIEINAPPLAVADAAPTSARIGEPFTFDGSDSTDDHGITSYVWEIDGLTVSEDPAFTTSFSEPGTYCATLTVTDTDHVIDDAAVCVVAHTIPRAVATVDRATVTIGNPVLFDGSASESYQEGPLTYAWYQDGAPVATTPSVELAFDAAGTYCLDLTVTDSADQQDSAQACVEVFPPLSVGVFPTKQTYSMGESPHVRVRVELQNQPLAGAEVALQVQYETGDALLDLVLAQSGCLATWSGSATTHGNGYAFFDVPPLDDRCGTLGGLELANPPFRTQWSVTAQAVKGGYSGDGSGSYRVFGV